MRDRVSIGFTGEGPAWHIMGMLQPSTEFTCLWPQDPVSIFLASCIGGISQYSGGTGRKQEDHEVKAILSHTGNFKPVWATLSLSQKQNQKLLG